MQNLKVAPLNPLVAKYINCYWLIEKTHDDSGPDFPKLNPDPAAHLIFAAPRQAYKYGNETFTASGFGSHLILPQSKTLTIDHSKAFLIVGLKFQVGALYALKIPSQHVLLNQVIGFDVSDFLQIEESGESDILHLFSESPEICRSYLDTHLKTVFSGIHEDKHSELVRNVLGLDSNIALSKIGKELGCSQRTVERSFSRVTGFSLKQYFTMERLEALLSHLYSLNEKDINWAEIAQNFGFSDQPHLVRYLKYSIGNTPGEYAKNRDLTIDAYGKFE